MEWFLPFGLQTAPYLFNFFAEVFHWILDYHLQKQGLQADIIHYLVVSSVAGHTIRKSSKYSAIFKNLCSQVGLAIKISTNEDEHVVSFGGVELDTKKMVVRLPIKKFNKAQSIVQTTIEKDSLWLLDLQTITGYLNFVCSCGALRTDFSSVSV